MSAYLFTSDVTQFIVPGKPRSELAVAPFFEQWDGLEPLDNSPSEIPFGEYGPAPRTPGITPLKEQTYTPGPIAGLVNTLGGQPLPVIDQIHRPFQGAYTPAGARTVGGPKMGRQAYGGQAETVFFADLQANPPQPGDIASIIAGLS